MRRLLLLLVACFFSTSTAWAVVGSSRSFDGTNDEVDWGDTLDVTTNDVSECVWVNMT